MTGAQRGLASVHLQMGHHDVRELRDGESEPGGSFRILLGFSMFFARYFGFLKGFF